MEAPRPAIQSKNAIFLLFPLQISAEGCSTSAAGGVLLLGGDAGCCSQIDKPEEKGEESAGLGGAAVYMEGGQL